MLTQFDQNVRANVVETGNQRLLNAAQQSQAMKAAFRSKESRPANEQKQKSYRVQINLVKAAVVAVTLFVLWLGTEVAAAAASTFFSGGGPFLVR